MASLGDLFGFSKSKAQGDYGGQKPIRYIDSPIFKPTFEGQGGVYDAIKRQNTGYDPKVMSDQESIWSKLAKRQFGESSANIGAKTSAGGLGRSSLAGAQRDYSNQGIAMDLANKSAQMRLANEANISQQQMQGRGLGVQGTAQDVASQQAIANFEKQEFDRQQAFRERADNAQKEGMLRSLGVGSALLGAGVGGVAGGMQGALAGMQMGGGLFSDPVSGAANAAKTLGIGGYEPTALINQTAKDAASVSGADVIDTANEVKSKIAKQYNLTVEQLDAILAE